MRGHRTFKFNVNERNLFFISDPHFDHKNIVNWHRTEFKDHNHMNEHMVKAWNSVVTSRKDIVFVAGDFCFGGSDRWKHFTNRLNGSKYLIIGNHDKQISGQWEFATEIMDISVTDKELKQPQHVTICHYPMLSWYQSHKGAWQLFGHVHGKLSNKDMANDDFTLEGKLSPRHLEIGADVWNYTPVSWYQIKNKLINIK